MLQWTPYFFLKWFQSIMTWVEARGPFGDVCEGKVMRILHLSSVCPYLGFLFVEDAASFLQSNLEPSLRITLAQIRKNLKCSKRKDFLQKNCTKTAQLSLWKSISMEDGNSQDLLCTKHQPWTPAVTESDTTKLAFLFFLTISTFVAIIKVGTLVSLPCHLGNEGDKNTSKHIRES